MPIPDAPWEGSEKEVRRFKLWIKTWLLVCVTLILIPVWQLLFPIHNIWGPVFCVSAWLTLDCVLFLRKAGPGERSSIYIRIFVYLPFWISALAIFGTLYEHDYPLPIILADLAGGYLLYANLFGKHTEVQ